MSELTNTDWLRARIESKLSLSPVGDKMESLESLRQTEWSEEFECLMRNRLLMGRFRYGKMGGPAKGKFDHVASMIQRLRLYQKTGNLEHLVDVANIALVKFVAPNHPHAHFDATDDIIHCEVKR